MPTRKPRKINRRLVKNAVRKQFGKSLLQRRQQLEEFLRAHGQNIERQNALRRTPQPTKLTASRPPAIDRPFDPYGDLPRPSDHRTGHRTHFEQTRPPKEPRKKPRK